MKTKSKPSECLELGRNAPHTQMRANVVQRQGEAIGVQIENEKNETPVNCTTAKFQDSFTIWLHKVAKNKILFYLSLSLSGWELFHFPLVCFRMEETPFFVDLIKPMFIWVSILRIDGAILTTARKLQEKFNSRKWHKWSAILSHFTIKYRNDSEYVKHQAVCAMFVLKFNVQCSIFIHAINRIWSLIRSLFVCPKQKKSYIFIECLQIYQNDGTQTVNSEHPSNSWILFIDQD